MPDFFALSPYHYLLAGAGAVIILSHWLPRFLPKRSPAASGLMIMGGLALFGFWPGMPEALDPIERPVIWEIMSEIAVIVALFATGIRIDKLANLKLWHPTIALLIIAMPLCLIAMTFLGTYVGLSIGAAILIAAVLVPTDPVLAADVQVGGPLEGGEQPIRFSLTTEAGLNDGLAFPFVYLGILVLGSTYDFGEWIGIYVFYKIIVGVVIGGAAGWVLGKLLFEYPKGNLLADGGSSVIAIAGVFFTYGISELVEGYGFIAVFVMGLVLRRAECDHEYHRNLHSFAEAIELTLTAILLIMVGAVLPLLWEYLDWGILLIGLALIFLLRPLSGMIALIKSPLPMKERALISFFGIRGVGSIFYLAYAAGQVQIDNIGAIWAAVAFTILISSIVHGFTASTFFNRPR